MFHLWDMRNMLPRWIQYRLPYFNARKTFVQKQMEILQSEQLKIKKKSKNTQIQLHLYQYPQLNKFICKFCNSSQQFGRVLGKHLAFVVGAHNIGKTTLIKNSLKMFQYKHRQVNKQIIYNSNVSIQYMQQQIQYQNHTSKNIMIINIDFYHHRFISWQGFVDILHQNILKNIINLYNNMKDMDIFNQYVIKDIILHQNSIDYIYVFIKDTINSILNDTDCIYMQNKDQLQQFSECIRDINSKQFFQKYYTTLLDLLQCGSNRTQKALVFFLSVFKCIEYQNRTSNYTHVTCIQTLDYLFDILNFLCGFGLLNKSVMEDYFHRQIQPRYSNFILQGNHIDVVLNLMNLYHISQNVTESALFCQFIDHLLGRLANESGLRTHFPVIIEIQNTQQLRQLQLLGKMPKDNPVVIEVPGIIEHDLPTCHYAEYFDSKVLVNLFYNLGRQPYVWNNFIDQLGMGHTLLQMKNMNTNFTRTQEIKFQAKLCSIATSERMLEQLDKGTLWMQMRYALNFLNRVNGLLLLDRHFYYYNFQGNSIFRVMIQKGILADSYYNQYISLNNCLNLFAIEKQLKIGLWNRLKYNIWKYSRNRYRFVVYQTKYKSTKDYQINRYAIYRKGNFSNDLLQTYYAQQNCYLRKYRDNVGTNFQ